MRDRIPVVAADGRFVVSDCIVDRSIFEQQVADVGEGRRIALDRRKRTSEILERLVAPSQADARDTELILEEGAIGGRVRVGQQRGQALLGLGERTARQSGKRDPSWALVAGKSA